MRYWLAAAITLGVLATGMLPAPAAPMPQRTPAQTAPAPGTVRQRLTSADGRYTAALDGRGRLVVRAANDHVVWAGPPTGHGATLHLSRTGQLWIGAGGHARWTAGTAGSGSHDVLTLRNDGVLVLTADAATVWSTRLTNRCPATRGKVFAVDLSAQTGRMCRSGQQLRATRVTTGATAHGDGTPTGTWHVQARVRNTTLHPADGGAYHVAYWLPYDGAYGVHDAPWQTIPYGSPAYRTRGSHGCVHVPGRMMAWLFAWARTGTTVTISR